MFNKSSCKFILLEDVGSNNEKTARQFSIVVAIDTFCLIPKCLSGLTPSARNKKIKSEPNPADFGAECVCVSPLPRVAEKLN